VKYIYIETFWGLLNISLKGKMSMWSEWVENFFLHLKKISFWSELRFVVDGIFKIGSISPTSVTQMIFFIKKTNWPLTFGGRFSKGLSSSHYLRADSTDFLTLTNLPWEWLFKANSLFNFSSINSKILSCIFWFC